MLASSSTNIIDSEKCFYEYTYNSCNQLVENYINHGGMLERLCQLAIEYKSEQAVDPALLENSYEQDMVGLLECKEVYPVMLQLIAEKASADGRSRTIFDALTESEFSLINVFAAAHHLALLKDRQIYLHHSNLIQYSAERWQAFCGATKLNLNFNYLNHLPVEHWQAFCEVLKVSGMTSLDISNNQLRQLSEEKWDAFCEALKVSGIQKLIVSSGDFSEVQLSRLKKILKHNFINGYIEKKYDADGNQIKVRHTPSLQNLCYGFFSAKPSKAAELEASNGIVTDEIRNGLIRFENRCGLTLYTIPYL